MKGNIHPDQEERLFRELNHVVKAVASCLEKASHWATVIACQWHSPVFMCIFVPGGTHSAEECSCGFTDIKLATP